MNFTKNFYDQKSLDFSHPNTILFARYERDGALTEWSIVQVCKTSVHGFESHGRLINLCLELSEQSVLYTTSDELCGSRKLYDLIHIAFLFCLKSDFFIIEKTLTEWEFNLSHKDDYYNANAAKSAILAASTPV